MSQTPPPEEEMPESEEHEQGQASSAHSSRRKRTKTDPVWKHAKATQLQNELQCNYCGIKYFGGANRMKYHLARITRRDVAPCPNVEQEISREMIAYLEALRARSDAKKRRQVEMARAFSGTPPLAQPFPESSNEPDIVQSTIGPRIRHGGAHLAGVGASGSSTTPAAARGRGAGLDFFASRSSAGGQPSLEATWLKEKSEQAKMAIANFFYYSDIPFNAARSPYFDYMVNAIAVVGAGMKAPSYHELRGRLLDNAVSEVNSIIDEQKKIWKRKGCSILSDGWTDGRGRTLLNFMVASSGGITFLKSIDASEHVKNADYLFRVLEEVILEVGQEHVVQVITDNATTYVAAGKLIEERFPTIFWTPCAAHCLDLLLEDIGKINWVKEVIDKAKNITKYIYTHSWVLNFMRTKFTDGKEIVRPGTTRFATSFLSLQSFCEVKPALMCMFVSPEWMNLRYANDHDALLAKDWLFDKVFTKQIEEILRFAEPLVKVLRIVDGDKSPMGYIYEAMDRAKEAIAAYYMKERERYTPIWEIIDRRWTRMIHRPLHAAGYFLNPKFFYADNFVADEEVSSGFHQCIERMHVDMTSSAQVTTKISDYREVQGYLFSSKAAIHGRETQAPDQWWQNYGAKTPLLQKMAVRVLSQPCSASGCERNWSTFENIHSKKRNRLTQEKLNQLVYVHYNLRLHHRKVQGVDHSPIDLDDIDPSDAHAEWVTNQPTQELEPPFDLSFDDFEQMEAQAIAEAEQELAAQAEASSRAPPQPPRAPPSQPAAPVASRSRVFSRKAKGKTIQ